MTRADQIERQARALQRAGDLSDGPGGTRAGATCADAVRALGRPLPARQFRRLIIQLREGCGCQAHQIQRGR